MYDRIPKENDFCLHHKLNPRQKKPDELYRYNCADVRLLFVLQLLQPDKAKTGPFYFLTAPWLDAVAGALSCFE